MNSGKSSGAYDIKLFSALMTLGHNRLECFELVRFGWDRLGYY
jgi:hypothetical protein